jgi:hypothetical protein
MNKKLLLIFPVTLILCYFIVIQSILWVNREEDAFDAQQTEIIQEYVKDRFNLFLKLPLSIGYIGSDYFAYNDKLEMDHSPFAKNLLRLNKDILGMNLVDTHGKIVSVYPVDDNLQAIGKISQNYPFLKQSLDKKESYWLSPPFSLFQGQQGFVFYIPILTKNGVHKGWFAPVMSTSLFDKEFKLEEFLKTYSLIIRDVSTGIPYFATGMEPDRKQKIYEIKSTVYGRDMEFLSWRKDSKSHLSPPWYVVLLFSLIPALFATILLKLFYQRKAARVQLQDISILLRLTSKEALAKLIDLQNEFYKIGSTENITFVTNLIEQIELLQTLAYTGEEMEMKLYEFLPLLENEIESLQELIQKKSLHVTYSPEAFKDINIEVNSWLLQNCVLSNILTHSIIHAESSTGINIDCKREDEKVFITFHTQMVISSGPENTAINLDRRMEVAKRALSFYKGDLFLQRDLAGGIIIRIILPI